MSAVHLVMLGKNALAVTFPDSEMEPLEAIMAKLRNAAAAVAYLASIEHERAGDVYAQTTAGALTAMEVLTGLSEALQFEAQKPPLLSAGSAGHD